MKLKEIEAKIGTLSNPAKMPSYAWGIPIQYCVTGSKLALQEGTICNKCYAGKGCYVFPVVKAMYEKRYQAIELPEWVDYMAELLTQKYKNLDKSRQYHRWFDSGDSPPPKFWKWTSGVHKDKKAIGRECPAPKQNGECGSCRACWSREVKQVSYKEH